MHKKLPNGYTVSIQNGSFNYCGPDTFETAIIDPTGEFVEYKGDTVQGWQTQADVDLTISFAESLKGASA